MEQNKRRSSLGRGLNALFGETAPEDFEPLRKGEHPRHLPIEFVTPGRFQPRRKFDPEAIQSLVELRAGAGHPPAATGPPAS